MKTPARVLVPASLITDQQANTIVGQFGFQARPVRCGFFLAPVTHNRFAHRHVGEDVMFIGGHGDITLYADDAQAFLAATALANSIKAAGGAS